jgi:hypothetical protein
MITEMRELREGAAMRSRIVGLIVAAALIEPSFAHGAELQSYTNKEQKVVVTLSGEIAEGDEGALKSIIREANNGRRVVATLRLSSPGGNILEAAKIADIVTFGKIATAVPANAICASACFIVFAAGNEKYANYAASVGVHGASDASGEETAQSAAATVTVARIVKEMGVPPSIIGKMVVTPPDQILWLSPDELRSMGVTMVGRPNQIATGPQPLTSIPSSQLKNQQDLTPSAKLPPTWDKLLDRAMELSASQNGGTPNIDRVCQPEFKECINVLFFRSPDDADMFMKVAEDINGKTVKREICSLNPHHDVRTCVDWDNGAEHRDMKNAKGEWYQVDR